jgi:hypothetical protein
MWRFRTTGNAQREMLRVVFDGMWSSDFLDEPL